MLAVAGAIALGDPNDNTDYGQDGGERQIIANPRSSRASPRERLGAMRQLTSVDAQFLALENARQSGHVGGLAILDPSTAPGGQLELADVQRMIAERLPLLPPMRWRLAEVPFGLDYPYWVDDEDFDLDFHVRELALPPPGTDEKLAEQVARIVSRPLDRARPLWELYLIHGLEHGYVGDAHQDPSRDHRRALRRRDHGRPVRPRARRAPSVPEPRGRRNGRQARRARDARPRPRSACPGIRCGCCARCRRALPNLDETAFGTLPGRRHRGPGRRAPAASTVRGPREGGELERSPYKPPRTSFNGRVSPHRRFVFGRLELERVKAVKNAHGCTVNDVVVSICAGAVRRWLISHTELPARPARRPDPGLGAQPSSSRAPTATGSC